MIPKSNAYIYLRCSHQDSVDSGLGLSSQYDQAVAYFQFINKKPEYSHLVLDKEPFVDEAVSAWKKRTRALIARPAGCKLQTRLRRGDHVIFSRMDRAFRWVPEFIMTLELWKAQGITMHFVDLQVDLSTANGELIAGIMAMVAQWHSRYISERTKEGLARRTVTKKERKHPGLTPNKRVRIGWCRVIPRLGQKMVLRPTHETYLLMRYVVMYMHITGCKQFYPAVRALDKCLAKREGRKPRGAGFAKYHHRHVTIFYREMVSLRKSNGLDRMGRRIEDDDGEEREPSI